MKHIKFEFCELKTLELPDDALLLRVKTFKTEQEVMLFFSDKLNYPIYFGNNWDALADCLVDLSWLT